MGSGRGRAVALAAVLGCVALAGATPAAAETKWACLPGQAPNPCRESLSTTVYEPGGGSRLVEPGLAESPKIDCFYVYPTISNQLGPNATRSLDPEVVAILRYQAQRFSQQCRVFAPLYRQITVPALLAQGLITTPAARNVAYGDVVEAWNTYLRDHNRGRGVVLIGHSQGTGVLRRLIRDEIDPRPEVRSRLVSAVLLGGNVLVKPGSDRGGDFSHIPICTRGAQAGCALAWSTFWDPPPSGTRFGRPPAAADPNSGLPGGAGYEVACTNPASLARNDRVENETLISTAPFPPIVGLTLLQTYGGAAPTAPTPWLQPADRYSGRCERVNGAHVLMIRGLGGAPKLNASPEPGWGLHIVDVNIAMGDIQRRVAESAASWSRTPAARAPRLELRLRYRRGRDARGRRCARPPIAASLTGADRGKVRRADFRVGRRLAKRDRGAPFTARLSRKRLGRARLVRIAARAALADGRVARPSKRVRVCRG